MKKTSTPEKVTCNSIGDWTMRKGFGDPSWPSGTEADNVLKKILGSREKDPFAGILCPRRKRSKKKKKRKNAFSAPR